MRNELESTFDGNAALSIGCAEAGNVIVVAFEQRGAVCTAEGGASGNWSFLFEVIGVLAQCSEVL